MTRPSPVWTAGALGRTGLLPEGTAPRQADRPRRHLPSRCPESAAAASTTPEGAGAAVPGAGVGGRRLANASASGASPGSASGRSRSGVDATMSSPVSEWRLHRSGRRPLTGSSPCSTDQSAITPISAKQRQRQGETQSGPARFRRLSGLIARQARQGQGDGFSSTFSVAGAGPWVARSRTLAVRDPWSGRCDRRGRGNHRGGIRSTSAAAPGGAGGGTMAGTVRLTGAGLAPSPGVAVKRGVIRGDFDASGPAVRTGSPLRRVLNAGIVTIGAGSAGGGAACGRSGVLGAAPAATGVATVPPGPAGVCPAGGRMPGLGVSASGGASGPLLFVVSEPLSAGLPGAGTAGPAVAANAAANVSGAVGATGGVLAGGSSGGRAAAGRRVGRLLRRCGGRVRGHRGIRSGLGARLHGGRRIHDRLDRSCPPQARRAAWGPASAGARGRARRRNRRRRPAPVSRLPGGRRQCRSDRNAVDPDRSYRRGCR